ncbi:mandelate racemase/muconate lactonizing enzyme family protein [Qingshengfaniella alkalisoli]|uniref:Mandelate racemase/muconate lactonizing enzyme family protein n=1 Tax=Qingshengfaniella alkalisoli TaxID=2599296 RepID=A0A5B8J191_9RHOB|nr:mandelate racemase/muconate lactonizing enzyme family protein [Qingshengfaniella alkalisoli]QDY71543.1 mandelate racemase/muconate lactonizing enzyme family protein [Qingshengfaniella alkalisoli]
MKIHTIETIHNPGWSNYVWVRIGTEAGWGLGETFRHATPIIRYLHDHVAPSILGSDAGAINAITHRLAREGGTRFLGYPTRSVEIRANSAVDIALWDHNARAVSQSLSRYLGGPFRDSIPIYNTCAGPGYNTHGGIYRARTVKEGSATPLLVDGVSDDLALQIQDPAALAQSLLNEGIGAMKIWPFDEAGDRNRGQRISADEMKTALSKISAIRDAVGDRIEILLEYHGLWRPAIARRILAEVDQFRPFWHEDPIPMEHIAALAELRQRCASPIAGSESHGTALWFKDALSASALDFAHFDIGWVGGISEALKVAHITDAYDVMIAPHDCTGPVTWIANLHLALSQPNSLWLESVRAYYNGHYRRMVTTLPTVKDGRAVAIDAPGLGTELSEELLDHPDTVIERSTL